MSIAENLSRIRAHLGKATLIAVSKTQSAEAVREALAAGQRIFGENRVQEAQAKFPPLRGDFPDLELHLIGALQTNKAADAVALFDVIQTLDRPKLADAVAKAIQKTGKRPRFYIEINIGREPQKAGIAPEDAEDFLAYCRTACQLDIAGLMCIPPEEQDPAPYFKELRALATRLGLPHISMGMSADYETAIACGATEVRVGTALFGKRPAKA
ncbi:MAG: YggS family pyridoxal phosphate-dependent enzyme [Alphaproteobacteria bacterium]|nr:YggS family pyridoxal phosphate-dependent enzyme [Alphaproteobacteria bacterium]